MSGICTWSAEETDDNVMGSGAEAWEWYVSGIGRTDDTYYVTMLDPETDEGKVYSFTRGKVRGIVTSIMMGKTTVNDEIRGYFKNDDPDAVAMDCVIQLACFGEVVYG